ncbi:hypothetical protein [Devosia epidermidihirudinis]|uniref:hypothetical protein n=1 Tax=Devosia epidermidihirudinis TaxID=1293439 RepID=UPI0006968A45|nr:hypothetical protein [Devosia epidermidihirudinis]
MLSFTDPAVIPSEADAYAEARLWSDWTGDEAVKVGGLRRGQDFIAQTYNGRWLTVWDNNDAPDLVKFAIIEAARRELVSPGSLAPDFVAARAVTREKKKVGPLEKELQYAEATSAASVQPVIDAIGKLLAGLIGAKAGSYGSAPLLRV